MPPQASHRLTLTPEELAKVARAKARDESAKVDENWLFVSEFGYYYGWAGVEAILKNKITMDVANVLLQGAIKVWCGKIVQQSQATYVANSAAQSKKGKQIMDKGLKEFKKHMKADE